MTLFSIYKNPVLCPNQHRLAVIDAGRLISEPWTELGRLMDFLHLNVSSKNVFSKKNFVTRNDGFFCILNSTSINRDRICMPKSKGRSKNVQPMPPQIEKYLYEFYEESNLALITRFHRTFSWMNKFPNYEDMITA